MRRKGKKKSFVWHHSSLSVGRRDLLTTSPKLEMWRNFFSFGKWRNFIILLLLPPYSLWRGARILIFRLLWEERFDYLEYPPLFSLFQGWGGGRREAKNKNLVTPVKKYSPKHDLSDNPCTHPTPSLAKKTKGIFLPAPPLRCTKNIALGVIGGIDLLLKKIMKRDSLRLSVSLCPKNQALYCRLPRQTG